MRPEILNPLFAPVTALSGIGPRLATPIGRLAGPKVVDLLWHLPSGLVDRRYSPRVADAPEGVVATLTVRVLEHRAPHNRRQPYRVVCSDDSGEITLVYFHARPDYLQRLLPEGETRVVSGTVEMFSDQPQISHPDHVVTPAEAETLPRIEPIYPLTEGLTTKPLAKAVKGALERLPELSEWHDAALVAREGWPTWHEAVAAVHAPASLVDLDPSATPRRRLAFDELLANQLALGLVRAHMRGSGGRVLVGDGRLRAKATAALPFTLTAAQQHSLAEIADDLASSRRMLRLLQGDVGSGKTVVALLTMLVAVEAGAQAAMLAPTEILARQHYDTIAPLAEAAGVRLAVLTGRDKGKAREQTLAALAAGEIDILVGTHALIQKDVDFADLGVAVIDEQHRFGVHQRMTIQAKGEGVPVLVMTATPIPRTLMLTAYGDMEVSRLTEKPPGRQPVTTVALPANRLEQVVEAVSRAIASDDRVYWVCPLVAESKTLDLAAAEARADTLRERFGAKVGLVHGQMKAAERDRVMADFASGAVSLLVATTVIEVGVDVREATVMVVEGAERFGLAQLHQLRGRVGRGEKASTCLLVYAPPLGETARARLAILRETEDGFRIAEEDLRLRGAGELLGTRQSGMPDFRLADLAAHGDLLAVARDDSKRILASDPELTGPRGEALRTLLYLFERDLAIRFLRSG
jgi:ATP-dependent DNA helicase RecG